MSVASFFSSYRPAARPKSASPAARVHSAVRQSLKKLANHFRVTSQTPGELFAILGHVGLAAYAIAMLIHLARTS